MSVELAKINEFVEKESHFVESILTESSKVIVGQRYVLERLLIGLLTGGHILLEGVPGLAKTLAVKTLSQCIDAAYSRLQFTPDLLPADVIGTLIYNQAKQSFDPKLGPVFANIVLADEINRAPAKVQSALLEAMQERQVTIGDQSYPLPTPFFVLATQNPIEQEGTYPLPEAQVDRFMMKLSVQYPSKEDELAIINRMTAPEAPKASAVASIDDILRAQKAVQQVYVDDKIKRYVLDLVFATRSPADYQLDELAQLIQFGGSPRASLCLIECAKAFAFIHRRGYVTPEDVKAIGRDVLRHRVIPSFEAEAEEVSSDAIVDRVFSEIDVP